MFKTIGLLLFLAATGLAQTHSNALTWSWAQGTGDPATGFHVWRSATTPVSVTGSAYAVISEVTTTGTASSGATSLTVASATGIAVGADVLGAGIASGTTVSAISGTTVTLSLATTAALSSTTVDFIAPAYTDTAVSAGQTWNYVVTAFNSGGDSTASNTVTCVTPFFVPGAPTGLAATSK